MIQKSIANKEKVLVVDDEASIRRILDTRLSMIGYSVITASDGEEALSLFRKETPNLVILDVMMPKLDGYGVCQEIRKTSDVPIIMLTALGDVADRITGLELGADDYVIKPFGIEELILRIKAILRRSTKNVDMPSLLLCGPISINDDEHLVTFNGEEVDLSPTEYRLLQILVEKKGRVLSKNLLLDEVWGITFESESTVVDTYISYLRKKLHRDGFEGIKTVRGVGFQIQEPK